MTGIGASAFLNCPQIRRFTVAETIDQEGIEASLADGVLKVRLPKAEPAKPRRIAVKVG